MTVTEPAYSARILGSPDVPVSMRSDAGSITLDVADAPHVTASITLAMPDATLLDDLDPRDGRRMVIEAGGRSFDLGIRRVRPDRASGTVGVELASDEALLDDLAQLVDDDGPRAHEASVRGVVDYVLGKLGAHLEAGGPDADVTAFWSVVNLLQNPSGEVDAGHWMSVGNAAGIVSTPMSAPAAPAGTRAIGFTAAAAGDALLASASTLTEFSVTPGRWYVFSYMIASQVSRSVAAVLQWRRSNGVEVVSAVQGATISSVSSEFRRVTVIGRAPAGVTHVLPYVRTTGNAAGNAHYVDAAMFYEGERLIGYFDGSTAPSGYTVAWQDAAHKSASTRTPVTERPPDALRWPAGVSALQFLRPLLLSAGIRLVCDELRRWTLRDNTYRAAGAQTFRDGVNIITADEEISREDERWFDGMVVRYRWTDRDGIEQERTDSYALPGASKIILRDVSAPYPGPGRAEYAVTRAQGTGSTVTGTKQATWTENTEQEFSAVLTSTPIQLGTAEKVVFDIAANTVTTTSRTTDTPAGAINLLQGAINALPGSINTL